MLFSAAAPPRPKFPTYADPLSEPLPLPSTHTPYPLPRYDIESGYGPTRIDTETLPDVPKEQRPPALSVVEALPSTQQASLPPLDSVAVAATEWDGFFMGQPDMRRPLVERFDATAPAQLDCYRSARSPRELLRDWSECASHHFQNTQAIFLRADIASTFERFSNHELGEVMNEMVKVQTRPGQSYTTKATYRTHLCTLDVTLPNIEQHNSHFTFLTNLESHLCSDSAQRLQNDPNFTSTMLQSFASLRTDDSVTAYQRHANYTVWGREKCSISNWIPGCGMLLFAKAQKIALGHVEVWRTDVLVDIVHAAVTQNWTDISLIDAVEKRMMAASSECPVEDVVRFWLGLALGGIWRPRLAEYATQRAVQSGNPSPQSLLAVASAYPIEDAAAIALWKAVPKGRHTVAHYEALFQVLLRLSDETRRKAIIELTVGDVEALDEVLVRSLRGFSLQEGKVPQLHLSLTHPKSVHFLKSTLSNIRILDNTSWSTRKQKLVFSDEMGKQQSGNTGLMVSYTMLRTLYEDQKGLRWLFDTIAEEYGRGNILLGLPSDELTLCHDSFGTAETIPLFWARFMVEFMPLVRPVIVGNHRYIQPRNSHGMDRTDEFWPLAQNSPLTPGGRNLFSNLHLKSNQKRVVKFERPIPLNLEATIGDFSYDTFIDKKTSGILRNERERYSHRRHLIDKPKPTDREGYYNFIDDVRRAGYAPSNTD